MTNRNYYRGVTFIDVDRPLTPQLGDTWLGGETGECLRMYTNCVDNDGWTQIGGFCYNTFVRNFDDPNNYIQEDSVHGTIVADSKVELMTTADEYAYNVLNAWGDDSSFTTFGSNGYYSNNMVKYDDNTLLKLSYDQTTTELRLFHIDVTDKISDPIITSHIVETESGHVSQLMIYGNYLIFSSNNLLRCIDITDINSPVLFDTYAPYVGCFIIIGQYIYGAYNCIYIYELSELLTNGSGRLTHIAQSFGDNSYRNIHKFFYNGQYLYTIASDSYTGGGTLTEGYITSNDITTDPLSPTIIGSMRAITNNTTPSLYYRDSVLINNFIYVGRLSWIIMIDISDPSNMVVDDYTLSYAYGPITFPYTELGIEYQTTNEYITHMVNYDDILYVFYRCNRLLMFDASLYPPILVGVLPDIELRDTRNTVKINNYMYLNTYDKVLNGSTPAQGIITVDLNDKTFLQKRYAKDESYYIIVHFDVSEAQILEECIIDYDLSSYIGDQSGWIISLDGKNTWKKYGDAELVDFNMGTYTYETHPSVYYSGSRYIQYISHLPFVLPDISSIDTIDILIDFKSNIGAGTDSINSITLKTK